MKKIFLVSCLIVLIAASCNSTDVPSSESNTNFEANPITPTPSPVPSPTPIPIKPKSNCDPNYSGCVPIASDVDCAGGSGNGPAYVQGPVQILGSDIYDLDRDNDGIACE